MTLDPRSAELVSSYVDGELSAEERARVERLLAENAALRHWHDELRALRTELQALPRHRAPAGLAAQVLTRVWHERPRPTRLLGEGGETGWTLRRWARPLAWSAMATAAALLVMLLSRDERVGRTVAQAPAEASDSAASRASNVNEAPPAAADRVARSGERGVLMKGGEASDAVSTDPAPSAAVPPAATAPPALTTPDADRAVAASAAKEKQQVDAPAMPSAEMRAPTKDAGSEVADSLSTDARAETEHAISLLASNTDLLVVQCDVTPEAMTDRALANTLAAQQIALSDAPADALGAKLPRADAPRAAEEGAADAGSADGRASAEAAPPPLELVYVEATPAQLEQTLDEIHRQTSQFLNVNVVPPRQVAQAGQKNYAAFNRQNAPELSVVHPEAQEPQTQAPASLAESDAPSDAAASDAAAAPPEARRTDDAAPLANRDAAPRRGGRAAMPDQVGRLRDGAGVPVPPAAAQNLQSAADREVTNFWAQPENLRQWNTQQVPRAQRIPLSPGNALEQTLQSALDAATGVADDARQSIEGAQLYAQEQAGGQAADGAPSERRRRRSEPRVPAQGLSQRARDEDLAAPTPRSSASRPATPASPPQPEKSEANAVAEPTEYQRAVFVLRVVDPAQAAPAAVAP